MLRKLPPRARRQANAGVSSVLITERLILTPLRAEDADEMLMVLDDERLHEFIGGRPLTLEELRARYQGLAAGSSRPDETWLNWIVRRSSDSQAMGTVQATITGPRRSSDRTRRLGDRCSVAKPRLRLRGGSSPRGMAPPVRRERDHRPHPFPPSGLGDCRFPSRPRADRGRS